MSKVIPLHWTARHLHAPLITPACHAKLDEFENQGLRTHAVDPGWNPRRRRKALQHIDERAHVGLSVI